MPDKPEGMGVEVTNLTPDPRVMDSDGTLQAHLTDDPGVDGHPVFASDGSRIAFDSDRTGDGDVYAMAVKGALQARVTTDAAIMYLFRLVASRKWR